MYLDELPDLQEVVEGPDEGDDEAEDDHEQEPVVVSQTKGSASSIPIMEHQLNSSLCSPFSI